MRYTLYTTNSLRPTKISTSDTIEELLDDIDSNYDDYVIIDNATEEVVLSFPATWRTEEKKTKKFRFWKTK